MNDPAKFTLFPEQASAQAGPLDMLFLFILLISLFFSAVLVVLLVYFALRYRRRSEDELPPAVHGSHGYTMEVAWSFGLLILFMVMFFWMPTSTSPCPVRPRTPPTSTSSAASGCGRSSIRKGSARSTS